MNNETLMFILQVCTIVITLIVSVFTIINTIKVQQSKNVLSVETSHRQKRREDMQVAVSKLLTYADVDNLKLNYPKKVELINNLTMEVNNIKTLLHIIYPNDLQLIKSAVNIKTLVLAIYNEFDNDNFFPDDVQKLKCELDNFSMLADRYSYIDWNRIRREVKGKSTKSIEWDSIFKKFNNKYLDTMIKETNLDKAKYDDFHMHTFYSDGELSPNDLVVIAQDRNLSRFSIVDHDTVDGVVELINSTTNKNYNSMPIKSGIIDIADGLQLVTGIEMSVLYNYDNIEIVLHLLGYKVNVNDIEFTKKLADRNTKYYSVLSKIIESLNLKGLKIDYTDIVLKFGRIVQISDIVDHCKTKFCINQDLIDYIWLFEKELNKTNYSIEDAIKIIHNCGGIAIIAHPLKYYYHNLIKKIDINNLEKIIVELKSLGLDGIEAMYADFNFYEQEMLVNIAQDNGMIATCGSDFHTRSNRFKTIDSNNCILYNNVHFYNKPIDLK